MSSCKASNRSSKRQKKEEGGAPSSVTTKLSQQDDDMPITKENLQHMFSFVDLESLLALRRSKHPWKDCSEKQLELYLLKNISNDENSTSFLLPKLGWTKEYSTYENVIETAVQMARSAAGEMGDYPPDADETKRFLLQHGRVDKGDLMENDDDRNIYTEFGGYDRWSASAEFQDNLSPARAREILHSLHSFAIDGDSENSDNDSSNDEEQEEAPRDISEIYGLALLILAKPSSIRYAELHSFHSDEMSSSKAYKKVLLFCLQSDQEMEIVLDVESDPKFHPGQDPMAGEYC